jgi:hypothetical protein
MEKVHSWYVDEGVNTAVCSWLFVVWCCASKGHLFSRGCMPGW